VAEAATVGVLLGVFEAGRVAVGSGAFVVADGVKVKVGTSEGVEVDVDEGVNVTVGGVPFKVKDPELFHLLPMKICISYKPGCHFSVGCSHTDLSIPALFPSHVLVS
jgi:hypothetical protein